VEVRLGISIEESVLDAFLECLVAECVEFGVVVLDAGHELLFGQGRGCQRVDPAARACGAGSGRVVCVCRCCHERHGA
jgi:hypothetical protein